MNNNENINETMTKLQHDLDDLKKKQYLSEDDMKVELDQQERMKVFLKEISNLSADKQSQKIKEFSEKNVIFETNTVQQNKQNIYDSILELILDQDLKEKIMLLRKESMENDLNNPNNPNNKKQEQNKLKPK